MKYIKRTFLILGLSFAMQTPDESKETVASDRAVSANFLALEGIRREKMAPIMTAIRKQIDEGDPAIAPIMAEFCEGFDELATTIDNDHGLSPEYWALEAVSTKKQLAEIRTELDEGKAIIRNNGVVNFNVNEVEYNLVISFEKRDEVLKFFDLHHETESCTYKEIPLSEIKNLILISKYLFIYNDKKEWAICLQDFSVISTPDLPLLFCQLSKFKAVLAECVKERGFSSCETEEKYLDLFTVMVDQAKCKYVYLSEIS